jgi:hypothetical protein
VGSDHRNDEGGMIGAGILRDFEDIAVNHSVEASFYLP